MKKIIIALLGIVGILLMIFGILIGVMYNNGWSITIGRCIVSKHDSYLIVKDKSVVELSNLNEKQELSTGDQILVLHDGILESFPGRTTVYFYTKLKDGDVKSIPQSILKTLEELGWLDPEIEPVQGGTEVREVFDCRVAYANWTDNPQIYEAAVNGDLIKKEQEEQGTTDHLPLYQFTTKEELDTFQETFQNDFAMTYGYDEVPSFVEIIADYDEAYFEEFMLFVVYVESSSGSLRFGVNSIENQKDGFCIYVEQTNDVEIMTEDMAGWFVTVAVSKEMVKNRVQLDAKKV